MIEHIFSIIILISIFIFHHSHIELFTRKNRIKRMILIILAKGFSVIYLLSGILAMKDDFSMVSLFEIEYGLFFLYMTYRLYNPSRGYNFKIERDPKNERSDSECVTNETFSISQLIRETMICLEDGELEKAQSLIDKVDTQFAVDQNIVLLRQIVSHSHIKDDLDYSDSLCY